MPSSAADVYTSQVSEVVRSQSDPRFLSITLSSRNKPFFSNTACRSAGTNTCAMLCCLSLAASPPRYLSAKPRNVPVKAEIHGTAPSSFKVCLRYMPLLEIRGTENRGFQPWLCIHHTAEELSAMCQMSGINPSPASPLLLQRAAILPLIKDQPRSQLLGLTL